MIMEHKGKLILLAIVVIIAYVSLYWLPKDNDIEQFAEKIIEEQTGAKVDLTP